VPVKSFWLSKATRKLHFSTSVTGMQRTGEHNVILSNICYKPSTHIVISIILLSSIISHQHLT